MWLSLMVVSLRLVLSRCRMLCSPALRQVNSKAAQLVEMSWCIRHLWSQHKLRSPSEGLPCEWHCSVLCSAAQSGGPQLVQQQGVCKMQHPLS